MLEELSQKEVFQEKNVDADALKMILDFLNTKFEEKIGTSSRKII